MRVVLVVFCFLSTILGEASVWGATHGPPGRFLIDLPVNEINAPDDPDPIPPFPLLNEEKTVSPKDTIHRDGKVFVLVEAGKVRKPVYWAVKNNLLFDLALLPNLAVEIAFGKNKAWSVEAGGNWSWWNTAADDYYYHRIQMASLELRHWPRRRHAAGRNPLNGWYVGVYGYGGDYDIRLLTKKNSDEGEQSRWTYSAGLTAGYALPISRHFNLEFGLSGGYLGGEYKRYTVSDCADGTFPLKSIRKRNYYGLTKASISLVWVIGKNKRKETGR